MDIITGFKGEKHIYAWHERDINQGIIGPGSYVLGTGMMMEAEVSSNNQIKIRDGVLMHQGCAAAIKKNTYESITIINGSQGMKRIDLIVARYQRNQDTGVESLDFVVIQGVPAETNPQVPAYTEGDIQAGDYVADMPMYQVVLDGLNITEVKKVFETMMDMEMAKTELDELNSKSETVLSFESGWSSIEVNTIKRKSNTVEITIKALKSAALPATGTLGTIPDGYRPSKEITIPAVVWTSTATNVSGSITIGTDGTVTFRQSGSASRWVIFHTLYNVL